MKRNISFTLISLLLAMTLAGCEAKPMTEGQKTNENGIDLLTLSVEESDAYYNYKATYNEEELRDLQPISVMKLYIHAGVEKDYETEWELYIKKDNQLSWDKEYHLKIPERDRMSDYSAFENAVNIETNYGEDGEYAVVSWEDKHLEEYDADGNPFRYFFGLVKSEEGVWKASFLPMQ